MNFWSYYILLCVSLNSDTIKSLWYYVCGGMKCSFLVLLCHLLEIIVTFSLYWSRIFLWAWFTLKFISLKYTLFINSSRVVPCVKYIFTTICFQLNINMYVEVTRSWIGSLELERSYDYLVEDKTSYLILDGVFLANVMLVDNGPVMMPYLVIYQRFIAYRDFNDMSLSTVFRSRGIIAPFRMVLIRGLVAIVNTPSW